MVENKYLLNNYFNIPVLFIVVLLRLRSQHFVDYQNTFFFIEICYFKATVQLVFGNADSIPVGALKRTIIEISKTRCYIDCNCEW